MNTILKWGVILGVLVEIWSYLYVAAGWHRSPATFNLFWVVVLIQIVVLIMALRETAAQGRRFGGQVLAGTMVSIVGGLIILVASYVLMSMVFPDYASEVVAMQEEALRAAGRGEEEIQQIVEMAKRTSSPLTSAITGCIGTVITGFVCSLLIGAFIRAKSAPQPA